MNVMNQFLGENFAAYHGDSGEVLKGLPENSIDLSVYSPPFADLFVYSNSERDLGNSRTPAEFFAHYRYMIAEILRVTKPGRITCVHTADIPAMKERDGYMGMKDFPGAVIDAYESEGWIYWGYAVVAKNPQAQAIRTKSHALLFKTLARDSASSRPAILDRVLFFKKPGENAVPVTPVENGEIDNEIWINWAGGIWTDIRETETLQYSTARDTNDEKHVAPLQLDTIRRCVKLYSNPGETILTPFMGIGSEAYVALQEGRKAVGVELKETYFNVAVKNLRELETSRRLPSLFDFIDVEMQAA
jgi:DNA modification methylase